MITENIDVKNGICNGTTGYITGMYCYIMRTNKFPYGAAHYASKIELNKYNNLIKNKKI